MNVPERIAHRVTIDENGCWVCDLAIVADGYSHISIKGKIQGTHRWTYEQLVGPIPEGLTIDHLCRVRNCVNPEHMEPVTNRENILRGEGITAVNARKTHCPQGHPYSDDNTGRSRGERTCLTCKRESQRKRYAYERDHKETP